jgi:hypothetical protein
MLTLLVRLVLSKSPDNSVAGVLRVGCYALTVSFFHSDLVVGWALQSLSCLIRVGWFVISSVGSYNIEQLQCIEQLRCTHITSKKENFEVAMNEHQGVIAAMYANQLTMAQRCDHVDLVLRALHVDDHARSQIGFAVRPDDPVATLYNAEDHSPQNYKRYSV